jgi:hypothetical protein
MKRVSMLIKLLSSLIIKGSMSQLKIKKFSCNLDRWFILTAIKMIIFTKMITTKLFIIVSLRTKLYHKLFQIRSVK